MADQSNDYTNLKILKDALIQEHRALVQDWARSARLVDAPELGEKIKNIQASLDAVTIAIKEEYKAQGIAGFI